MKISALILFLLVFLSSCGNPSAEKLKELLNQPMRSLTNYQFNPSSSVISRVRPVPTFLMKYLQEMDQDTNYRSYYPAPREMKIIEDALGKLPPLNRRVLQERLVGLYFVSGLYGSGLTDWITAPDGGLYCVMFINPELFKMDLSQWLTWKENTVFDPGDGPFRLRINCGGTESAMTGILIHESTHAVDYVKNITPYVEPATLSYDRFRKKKVRESNDFTSGTWISYERPLGKYEFSCRKKVRFYSSDKTKQIPGSSAISCYSGLLRTPFVSLYGSKIWAEDLAELVLFYHVTRSLWQPYEITVENGTNSTTFRPLESPLALERVKNIRMFYE